VTKIFKISRLDTPNKMNKVTYKNNPLQIKLLIKLMWFTKNI